jgi:beta-galactosidase
MLPRRESPDGTRVRVPHCWDGGTDVGWYRRTVRIPPGERNRRQFLHFQGAASVAEVFVNGRAVGRHQGAFTGFTVDVTEACDQLVNRVDVRVSNRADETRETLPSSSGRELYHVQGGLSRPVSLISTGRLYVDPTDEGASGVRFRTPTVRAEGASFEVTTLVRNAFPEPVDAGLDVTLTDDSNTVVWRHGVRVTLRAGERRAVGLAGSLVHPHLWGPGHPSLYGLHVELTRQGQAVDRVSQRVGFRDFRLGPDGTFMLNGTPIEIRGIGRHQAQEVFGSATEEGLVREDFRALRDLGVNMVRLAHYPQAPLAYDLADRLGILVWAENGNSNDGRPGGVGERITREMVRQLGNHPSIVTWCVGNETGFNGVARYAAAVREEDPQRLVTYATNTKPPPRARRDLDFVAYNLYTGWYGKPIGAWDNWARRFKYISETGAGAVLTNHVDYADAVHHINTFESEEYAQRLFEFQLDTVFRREHAQIPMYLVWILRDFPIEKYKGVLNTKGFLTRGGRRKDPFFLYKAFLRPATPVVHITSKTYFLRRGRPDNGIKVYSNLPRLALQVNGHEAGWARNGHALGGSPQPTNVFYWPVALQPGRNDVRVSDGQGHEDRAIIYQWARGTDRPAAAPDDIVADLASSNPSNPAVFIAAPALASGPFYYEFDASADNTWGVIPSALEGAGWIATRRLSKPDMRTTLSFRLRRPGDVYVVASDDGGLPRGWCPGFAPTEITGWWWDNQLQRKRTRVLHRRAAAGARVVVPGATRDYVVLVKPVKS